MAQKLVLRQTYNSSREGTPAAKSNQQAAQKDKKTTSFVGSFSESDRYFSASSDEEYEEDDDDYDDDDICIRLDSDDDDDGSLSGFHINLKTLQAVSTMLAHYSPIIQSDIFGNPTFVPPPPPPNEEYYEEERSRSCRKLQLSSSRKPRIASDYSYCSAMAEDEEYQYAMQELEDVLLSQDNPTLTDAMTELSDVMEKMTRFTEELNQDSQ